MTRYLLDTNHLADIARPRSRSFGRLSAAHKLGHKFGTIVPAVAEWECGLRFAADPESSRRFFRQITRELRVWPLEYDDAVTYGRLFNELRARGRQLSQIDIILAAIATRLGATLLTSDRDFEALPELPQENWLV